MTINCVFRCLAKYMFLNIFVVISALLFLNFLTMLAEYSNSIYIWSVLLSLKLCSPFTFGFEVILQTDNCLPLWPIYDSISSHQVPIFNNICLKTPIFVKVKIALWWFNCSIVSSSTSSMYKWKSLSFVDTISFVEIIFLKIIQFQY